MATKALQPPLCPYNSACSCKTNTSLFAFNIAERVALCDHLYRHHTGNNVKQKTKSRNTLVVNEDITIKSVPKEQDIFMVFKIDVCSAEQVGIKTVERAKEKEGEVKNILM